MSVKVLFVAAMPEDASEFSLGRAHSEIQARLRHAPHFEFRVELAVTVGKLRDELLFYKPDIVHFLGHGTGDSLVLENSTGESQHVETADFRELIEILKGEIRLFVFTACFTDAQAEAVSQVVDFCVGTTDKILDAAVIEFSAALYQGLANDLSIQKAFDLGCNAVALAALEGKDSFRLFVHPGKDGSQEALTTRPGSPPAAEQREPPEQPEPNPVNDTERRILSVLAEAEGRLVPFLVVRETQLAMKKVEFCLLALQDKAFVQERDGEWEITDSGLEIVLKYCDDAAQGGSLPAGMTNAELAVLRSLGDAEQRMMAFRIALKANLAKRKADYCLATLLSKGLVTEHDGEWDITALGNDFLISNGF